MSSNFIKTALDILKETTDSNIVSENEYINSDVILDLGLQRNVEGQISVDREKRISIAMTLVEKGVAIGEIIELLTWKDFEGLVAGILTENGFRCIESFRRKGTNTIQGMEIDVVGIRGKTILAVDAKMWGIRGGKSNALRRAAEKQKERTYRLTSQFNQLSKRVGSMNRGEYEIIPIIVTWLVEGLELHDCVPVVPVFKFNSFILDFEQFQDIVVSYRGIY